MVKELVLVAVEIGEHGRFRPGGGDAPPQIRVVGFDLGGDGGPLAVAQGVVGASVRGLANLALQGGG